MTKYYSSRVDNLAHIAIKKSLLKEYHDSQNERIVYLNDGDEFQISIFNPYDYVIGLAFSFNSDNINNQTLLVIKPGERIWLDRYIAEDRKLLFSTYEIDNCKEAKKAIEKNGLLTIYFYKEQEKNTNTWVSSISTIDYPLENNILYCNSNTSLSNINCSNVTSTSYASSLSSITTSASSASYDIKAGTNSCLNKPQIETGRIEKGKHSNQKFYNYCGDFNSWTFKTEQIKLLPMSKKQVNSNDLKKKYCPECGTKIKDKFKYCPYCGAKQ